MVRPPMRCPRGHPLRPDRMPIRTIACSTNLRQVLSPHGETRRRPIGGIAHVSNKCPLPAGEMVCTSALSDDCRMRNLDKGECCPAVGRMRKLRSLGALYRETAVAHLDKADGCDVVALERAVR
jgi:hypothetical protein